MFNSYDSHDERNTIACRNTGVEIEVHGSGHYEQKAYNPDITIICVVDTVMLRTVKTSIATKYEILDDGFLLNRYPNEKTAINYFIDFAGITKGKFNKLKKTF